MQQRVDVLAASDDLQDQHVVTFGAVDDDVFTHGKGSQAGTQISISTAPHLRVARQQEEMLGDSVYHPVGYFEAAAFSSNVKPDVV